MPKFGPDNPPPGNGRPKGSRNKVSKELVNDVIAAYKQRGGIKYLKSLDDKLFCAMVTKILPTDNRHEHEIAVSFRQWIKSLGD